MHFIEKKRSETTVPLTRNLPSSRETRLVSRETRLVSCETRLVSRETRLVSRECTASTVQTLHTLLI